MTVLMWRLFMGVVKAVDWLVFRNEFLHFMLSPLLVAYADSKFFRRGVKAAAIVATASLLSFLILRGGLVMDGFFGYESDGKIPLKQFSLSLAALIAVILLRREVGLVLAVPFRLIAWFATLPGWITWLTFLAFLLVSEKMDQMSQGQQGYVWRERELKFFGLMKWVSPVSLAVWALAHYTLQDNFTALEVGAATFVVASAYYAISKEWVVLPANFQIPGAFDESGGVFQNLFQEALQEPPQKE